MPQTELITLIKELRRVIDFDVKTANTNKRSAETTLALRSLQLAKGWLGKALGYIGESTPYTVVATTDAIPPTADESKISNMIEVVQSDCTFDEYLEYFNDNRRRLKAFIPRLQDIYKALLMSQIDVDAKYKVHQATQYCEKHVEEASMWYGFEIANLRKTN